MVLSLLFVLLSTPTLAYGYTDPGSGIMIYQMLVAGIAGFAWTARKFLRRLISRSE